MTRYSRDPENPSKSVKARGSYLRTHFKNTREVGNAIKYGKSGGRVEVIWKKSETDNDENPQISLIVRDNGPGIAAEHLPRLFERFYRVDKARSREVGGTGLGLAIVKHILQSHGGSVAVRSEVGSGTEFICSFPDRN